MRFATRVSAAALVAIPAVAHVERPALHVRPCSDRASIVSRTPAAAIPMERACPSPVPPSSHALPNPPARRVPPPIARFDLVVYGGTPGGIVAAVAAAREGLRVALLEPTNHIGGMMSGGLGWTDYGRKEVIGGYALEVFQRLGKEYGQVDAWRFEPHVAERVFTQMAHESGVSVIFGQRLRERTGVVKQGTRIVQVTMENGNRYQGAVFVDASYEGDLMAQAGVSYTVGREGAAQYREALAGAREFTPKHQFTVKVPGAGSQTRSLPVDVGPFVAPNAESGALLPGVQGGAKGPIAGGDRKVQAYTFRLCLTDDPKNRAPILRPPRYDPARYELLIRYIRRAEQVAGRPLVLREVVKPDPMGQNHKVDVNNNGAVSTDAIGASWDYPEGDYATRRRIWQEHADYVAGFFYFLQHDPRVPKALQAETRRWGLARDEFADNGNWPYQLYIREARRMTGGHVMTQRDIQTDLVKYDAIGMGAYNSDSHNVQRIIGARGVVENEGDLWVPVEPYQIPYRVMLPKRAEATNLLVTVALSASHVAFSTLRMEPQFMIIGQAAGVAAKLAVTGRNVAMQDVDLSRLTAALRTQGAVLQCEKPFWPLRRWVACA
jgi:hypothetical protein